MSSITILEDEEPDIEWFVDVRIKMYKNKYMSITSDDVPGLTLGGIDYIAVAGDLIPAITTLRLLNGPPK